MSEQTGKRILPEELEERVRKRRQAGINAIANQGNFTGSESFYAYMCGCLLTEGTKWIAEMANCFWFMDVVASYQGEAWAKKEDFQVWKLECDVEKGVAHVICEDGNDNELVRQFIPNTDFPVPEFTIWAERNELGGMTLLLPSEH